ncbi:MAG: adenosine deaminase, partial [Rhodospirillaceae bacterium]|nr:adenosine deaminase [Rhodospirillaceae bacterium]
VEAAHRAYRFDDLQSFLDLYYRGMNVLLKAEDFRDLALAYFARAHADNVRHAELFFDPQAHTDRGVALDSVFEGLCSAMEQAATDYGITSCLIPNFLRHLDESSAQSAFDACLDHRDAITGSGLDSGERGNPPSKFARVFERVRAEGFHIVAHAGEEGPASYVTEALDILGAERIDHGVRAMDDDALIERLAAQETVLTVCPQSNVRLKVVAEMADHPLKRMAERGLKVTINSDDPSYFGAYIGDNMIWCQQALALTREDLVAMTQNAITGSFVDQLRKKQMGDELADCSQV